MCALVLNRLVTCGGRNEGESREVAKTTPPTKEATKKIKEEEKNKKQKIKKKKTKMNNKQ